jgi:hypothetical protein
MGGNCSRRGRQINTLFHMYGGFKLGEFGFENRDDHDRLLAIGEDIFDSERDTIKEDLKNFIFSDNSLDGSKIQGAWFPQVDASVFIAHSHNDRELAFLLAGWLKEQFEIVPFIDSSIWGYADDLLKLIDNKYCRNDDGKTYNYHIRNYSTSQVHMMLSSALMTMIDKVECFIFLDTISSIIPYEGIQRTESPWIYFEIGVSQSIRKKIPERRFGKYEKLISDGQILEKGGLAKYELDLNHLTIINSISITKWAKKNHGSSELPLDILYSLCPRKIRSDSLHK